MNISAFSLGYPFFHVDYIEIFVLKCKLLFEDTNMYRIQNEASQICSLSQLESSCVRV